MKMEGRTAVIVCVVIAVVGISGFIEAAPHTSVSLQNLAIDAALLGFAIGGSVLLARRFGSRGRTTK